MCGAKTCISTSTQSISEHVLLPGKPSSRQNVAISRLSSMPLTGCQRAEIELYATQDDSVQCSQTTMTSMVAIRSGKVSIGTDTLNRCAQRVLLHRKPASKMREAHSGLKYPPSLNSPNEHHRNRPLPNEVVHDAVGSVGIAMRQFRHESL